MTSTYKSNYTSKIIHESQARDNVSMQQGNSVAWDLPPTGSQANTTIFIFIYILDIDSHCSYLLLFF